LNRQNFGLLNIKVNRSGDAPVIRLEGFAPGEFAKTLGVDTANAPVKAIEAQFKPEWCSFSPTVPGVFFCQIPTWQWPRPTLTAKVLGDGDADLGTVQLGVLDIGIEKTARTSATRSGDLTRDYMELSVYGISETNNAARISHETRYLPTECRSAQ